jgi:hypothetical protein
MAQECHGVAAWHNMPNGTVPTLLATSYMQSQGPLGRQAVRLTRPLLCC